MMRIIFCCQFYAPSVGGVQEVIRQIAERLVKRGHQVTVATTKLSTRDFETLNGVVIREFDVKGNWVSGMSGEIKAYQDYMSSGSFDVAMIYAAQQWTFDALWPVLDKIKYSKVLVPCGFSGLYEPGYAKYFHTLPEILKKFDHLIFHASKYRDIDFAHKCGIEQISVVPNGASEIEFEVPKDPTFRTRNGIPTQSFVFLTVGSFTGLKGHQELADAFTRMKLPEDRHATLIMNGNEIQRLEQGTKESLRKLLGLVKTFGLQYALKIIIKRMSGSNISARSIAKSVNKSQINKQVLITDLSREELVQAYMAANIFVFASNIEYSPLVLFEAAAAGTPFLTVSVGNAAEIAQWTGAGILCPSEVDAKGYTRVNVKTLGQMMEELMKQIEMLKKLGITGKQNWRERFTWATVTDQYEQLFCQLIQNLPEKPV